MEKARKEDAEKRAEKQTDDDEESAVRISEPKDVIEISQEAIAALQNKQSGTEEQSGDTTDYITAQAVKQKEKPLIEKEPQTYMQAASIKIDGEETVKIKHGSLDIKL